jgi:glutamate/tyrosine decarboxylase-like PLP-dependent enzyme
MDVELADSWSVDGHKTLNTPYDCGIVLCRQRDALVAAMQASGAYIQYSHNRDGMMHVPEMSRRARVVDLWATLKYLGRSGVGEMIDRMCDRATQFADRLAAQDFRILNEVVFNQVLVAGESPSSDAGDTGRYPGVGCLLVRWDRVEWRTGHSHQRELLGHHAG